MDKLSFLPKYYLILATFYYPIFMQNYCQQHKAKSTYNFLNSLEDQFNKDNFKPLPIQITTGVTACFFKKPFDYKSLSDSKRLLENQNTRFKNSQRLAIEYLYGAFSSPTVDLYHHIDTDITKMQESARKLEENSFRINQINKTLQSRTFIYFCAAELITAFEFNNYYIKFVKSNNLYDCAKYIYFSSSVTLPLVTTNILLAGIATPGLIYAGSNRFYHAYQSYQKQKNLDAAIHGIIGASIFMTCIGIFIKINP